MSMNDPISDMLTRVRNACSAGHKDLSVPFSKKKESILDVIRDEGYIRDFEVINSENVHKSIKIYLKFVNNSSSFSTISRVSKPGRRIYSDCANMPQFHGGLGIYIVSTSKGVMSDYKARIQNVGGEILCKIF